MDTMSFISEIFDNLFTSIQSTPQIAENSVTTEANSKMKDNLYNNV